MKESPSYEVYIKHGLKNARYLKWNFEKSHIKSGSSNMVLL